jgi:hypothetical protein
VLELLGVTGDISVLFLDTDLARSRKADNESATITAADSQAADSGC